MPIHDWTRVQAGTFHAFHYRWISALCDHLNMGGLPRGYFALPVQVIEGPIPDILTLQEFPVVANAAEGNGGGGIAVLTMPPRTRFVQFSEPDTYARKANRITIRHEQGKPVAVIEIVSPGNKGSQHALAAFVKKAVELLEQGIHLTVVDLFPPSVRDPQGIHGAIWAAMNDESFELPKDKPLRQPAGNNLPIVGPICY